MRNARTFAASASSQLAGARAKDRVLLFHRGRRRERQCDKRRPVSQAARQKAACKQRGALFGQALRSYCEPVRYAAVLAQAAVQLVDTTSLVPDGQALPDTPRPVGGARGARSTKRMKGRLEAS
jgi:hypothetical protein